jgi:hypothetical protein
VSVRRRAAIASLLSAGLAALCACGSATVTTGTQHHGLATPTGAAAPAGGGGASGAVAAGVGSNSGTPAPGLGGAPGAGGPTGAAAGAGSGAAASATPLPYAAGTTPAPATATLSATCVRPGGAERLTVTAPPGLAVAYDVQYADGSDGHTYGGVGQSTIPPSGTFVASWAVAPSAAHGTAVCYVSVAGGNQSAFRQPAFRVADSC